MTRLLLIALIGAAVLVGCGDSGGTSIQSTDKGSAAKALTPPGEKGAGGGAIQKPGTE